MPTRTGPDLGTENSMVVKGLKGLGKDLWILGLGAAGTPLTVSTPLMV